MVDFNREDFAKRMGEIEQKDISAEAVATVDALLENASSSAKKLADAEKKVAELQQTNQKLYLQLTEKKVGEGEGNSDEKVKMPSKKEETFDAFISAAKGLEE